MAGGGEKSFCNEIPENYDYILYSEDLVNYVMFQNARNYVVERDRIPFRAFVKNPFNGIIQRSLCDILSCLENNNECFAYVMRDNLNVSPDGFTSIANQLEQDAFDQGFNGKYFLIYSVSVSYLAALFYNRGIDTAPMLAKSHIINVLKNRMPPYGWNIVSRAAEIYPLAEGKSSETSDSD